MRKYELERVTKETKILISVNLDESGICEINTPIPFFNHMLEQIAKHAKINLKIEASADIEIDSHHLIEDVGIVFGEVLKNVLGDKKGIKRYADKTIAMDECLIMAALDISGRSGFYMEYNWFSQPKLGNMDTEMIYEFFKSLSYHSKITLHFVKFRGENNHHIAETMFKSFAMALREAVAIEGMEIPSTKGVL